MVVPIKYLFIGSVLAIDCSVTHPLLRDADLVGASKLLVRVALGRRTIQLVRIVPAIVVEVAHPPLLDALSVGASELGRWTSLIWMDEVEGDSLIGGERQQIA